MNCIEEVSSAAVPLNEASADEEMRSDQRSVDGALQHIEHTTVGIYNFFASSFHVWDLFGYWVVNLNLQLIGMTLSLPPGTRKG